MVKGTADRKASQDARLRQKTQEHQLQRLAIQGAGLTPWEADVLVRTVREVFFGEPTDRPLSPGQMRYSCVAATEGAGRPSRSPNESSKTDTIRSDASGPSSGAKYSAITRLRSSPSA